MHNQKRDEYKARLRDDATASKLAQKATQWYALSSELIKRRQESKQQEGQDTRKTLETLKLTDKLLSVNPDPNYLWNHRRELLLELLETKKDLSPKDFIHQEQVLTQAALQRNPKAYGAWFHRKWSIRQYLMTKLHEDNDEDMSKFQNLIKAELTLCLEFLMLDERNFHCWNYRRFIVSTLGLTLSGIHINNSNETQKSEKLNKDQNYTSYTTNIDGAWHFLNNMDDFMSQDIPIIGSQLTSSTLSSVTCNVDDNSTKTIQDLLGKEWEFTSEKIYQNFSNGSAFDYRSKLLPLMLNLSTSTKTRSDYVQEELDLIRNAVFTEPDDQTSWWYFRFILSWANPKTYHQENGSSATEDEIEEFQSVMYEEWTSIQELVEAEDGECKWGLLGLYMIAMSFHEFEEETKTNDTNGYQGENWLELAHSYLDDLKRMDPDRIRRYETLQQKLE
mmetsp:Transcript_6855/g.7477  ORF Transcript_6855/g.7477 Transcript_6855/m.7477 type:complete len:447 (-) Transcript_6855:133-1473(-)